MKKSIFLLLLLGIGVLSVSAQTKTIKKQPKKEESTEKDDYSEPEKSKSKSKSKTVKVYEPDDYDAPKSQKEGYIEDYNIIKYNGLALLNGCFPLLYERVLTPKWSVEATFGITYSEIKLGRMQALTNPSAASPEDDIAWGAHSFESGLGFVYGLAARYYFSKGVNIPEGGYILGGIQNHSYKFTAGAFRSPGDRGGGEVPTTVNVFDIARLGLGYQTGSVFYWDGYVGVALRHTNINGPYYDNNAVYIGKHSFGIKVMPLVSMRLGIAF